MKTHRYPSRSTQSIINPHNRSQVGHNELVNAIRSHWLPTAVGLALLFAILLPLNLLGSQPFHHDEALYTTWGLEIASGNDPWLAETPIDKPPLFLYTVAGAMWLLSPTESVARLPSLIATVAGVGLTFWLGRKLYGNGVGLLAAWLVALSPFTILFAPTAFTDPLLVALVLAGCVAAISGRAGWAGMWLGLAFATKQQGFFFVPLALALVVIGGRSQVASGKWRVADVTHQSAASLWDVSGRSLPVGRFTATLLLTLLPLFLWDFFRQQAPGFWQLSLDNYGGLSSSFGSFPERWAGFAELLQYATASPLLNLIFLSGLPLLLIYGVWQIRKHSDTTSQPTNHQTTQLPNVLSVATPYLFDWLFALFCLAFLLAHVWFSFQIWDRYLLGLIPFLALLLARILLLPWSIIREKWLYDQPALFSLGRATAALALGLLLALTLARPVQDAVNARYPLGSNSHALQGIHQIVAYLQGQVGANHTLYHRWLGAHWRFYLWDYPYDLQYWQSAQALASKAQPGHLIAFPTWQSDTEVRLALAETGLTLHELIRAYSPLGHPSIILYRIETAEE